MKEKELIAMSERDEFQSLRWERIDRHRSLVLQEDGSLAVTWRSGVLNAPPDYVVPPALRQSIVEKIEIATGRKVSSY